MAADITSLSIQVKSDGISQATKELDKLVTAAEKVQKVIPAASDATNKLDNSNSKVVAGLTKLLENFQKQADLLNKNTAESNSYTAALKGANDEQLRMARASGTVVDNYKLLSIAQKEAIAMNKALDVSNKALAAKVITDGTLEKARQYKVLGLAQAEAIAMNRALDASNALLERQMRSATVMDRARDYRLLAAAQAEALAMNRALDLANIRGNGSLDANSRGLRLNNAHLGDAHALVRGLTGSFNSLWLSYGNFAGMATGLAIGASLKGIVVIGKDVESILEGIRVKGNETIESVNLMRDAILSIGQGVYGPIQVAKAFETLILAGLTAKEALVGIKDALNLATVGGTTIEKSAYTLVQVSTALGYTAAGFGTVADVIAKTAAVSMSSVESLSEAFKSGSSIGKLYGASLVDIGTALGALSQLGIQGSAAGTSLKNFYKELGTDADKLKNTLKSMNMVPADLKDANGKFLDLVTVIERLSTGLDTLKPAQQQLAMQMLANERGMKTTVELLDMFRKKTGEAGNELKTFQGLIAESFGYASIGAAQMALTVDAQFKSVKNTLATTFTSVFKDIEPQLLVIAVKLREAFGSDGFKQSVSELSLAVANLTVLVVENAKGILAFIAALLAFKTVLFVATSITALSEGLAVLVKIIEATRFAAIALQLSLGILGAVLLTVGAAFTYFYLQRDGDKAKNEAAQVSVDEYVKSLTAEADRMQKINAELLANKSLKEADVKVTQDQATAMAEKNRQAQLEIQQNKANIALNALLKNDPSTMLGEGAQKRLEAKYAEELKGIAAVEAANQISRDNQNTQIARIRGEARLTASLEEIRIKKEGEAARKNAKNGMVEQPKELEMGYSSLNTSIKKIEEVYEVERRVVDSRIALVEFMNKSNILSDSEAAHAKELLLNKNVIDQKNALEKELEFLDSFKIKDAKIAEEIAGKRASIMERFGKLQVDEALRLQKIAFEPVKAAADFEKKQQDEADKTIESINKQTEALRAKNIAYASIPASVRAMGLTEKQMADEVTQVNIDQLQARLNGFLSLDAAGQDLHQKEMNRITDEINSRSKFMGEQQATEARVAANKAILDYNVQWKAANTKIGDDLASAIIDGGGSGFKKLIKDMKLAFAKLILQPILAPISGAFASATTGNGLGGVLGQATGATGVTGGVSGLAGLASAANSAYNAITTGFSSISGTVTNAVQGAMNFAQGSSSAASMGAYGPTAAGGNIATSGAASAAGTAAGYAAGAIAGKMIGSAISGEFGKNSVVNVATIAGSILGGPIGGAIGGAVGGLLNRAFGMGNKNVSSAGVTGTANESGVTGNSFSNYTQKGGFFRSDRSGTDTAALSSEIINSFKSTLVTLKGVSVDFAKNIDVGSGALVNYSKEFKLVLGSDAAANQKTITDFFTSMGDDMAKKLVPNIANFAFVSERASETLQRLSLVFSATNNLAGVLGKTVEQTFGSIGLASYDARQRLIELAGSLANLNTQVTFYATNFLTEADKIAPVQASVTAALAAMGLQAMTTTEQFSNVVKGLDLTTKAGAEQFSVLMALAPAFKQVADYIKESLVKMIKDATDKLDILKKDASDSFTVMSTLLTAQKAAGLALKDNANSAFEIVKGILELQKSSALELQSSLQATVASISKTPDSVMSRAAAQNQISNALDAAKSTGVLPTAASLSDALRVVSTPNSSLFATYVDFARDAGITAGKVSELSNLTAKSISNIEKQLSLAQIQVDLLNGVKVNTTDLITAMEEFSRATVAAQEGLIKANEIAKQLEFAQSQLDSLNDIKTKLSSMPSDQAIALDKQISFAQAQLDSLNGNKSSIILASLSQVNAIDKQIAVSQGQLEALNNSRNSILSTSSSQIASIERQINVSQGQLDTLKETKALSMNMPADQVAAIDKQISFAQAQLDSLNSNKSLLMFSTANQIAGVDSQISFAQAQLDSLNSSKSLTLSLASSQVAAIDKQISFAQAQLNALNDIKTLTFGVQSSVRDFNTSLQAALVQKEVLAAVVAQATTTAVVAQAAIATVVEKVSPSMPVTYVPPVVATQPVVKYVPPVYVGTGTRSDFETDAYGNVLANYEDRFKSPGFDINGNALDGSHAIGLDNVPFDGYNAKLHKGEMVLPASSAQAVRSDSSIAEIVLAVKESMQANSAENQSMASNLQILRKLFQQAMPGGNSLQTTTYVP